MNPDHDALWIDQQLAAVSSLHPAFDPAVWDLQGAEQDAVAQIDLAVRVEDLVQEVATLRRQVAEQTDLITRLLKAWTEE